MKGFMSCLIEKETKKAEEKATKRALLQGKKEGIDDGAYMMKRAVSDVINGYNTVSKLISKGYPESVAKNAIQIMDFTKK